MRRLRKLFLVVGGLIALPVLAVALYLGATVLGAMIPRETGVPRESGAALAARSSAALQEPKTRHIYLISNLLHADIALPVEADILARYGWLEDYGFPLHHPNLQYVAVGWGSQAFYTTAGSYGDIAASAVFKAATGDEPVMRFSPVGELTESPDVIRFALSATQFETLLRAIEESLAVDGARMPRHLEGASISHGDAFFSANGHFNIFHPCNQWAGQVLNLSDIHTGIWTPTTWSLLWSLSLHNG